MIAEKQHELRRLEGRTVHVALADGSVMDRVALVLARRDSLWVVDRGEDAFVPVSRVVRVWDAPPLRACV